jgi:hypothetical protein
MSEETKTYLLYAGMGSGNHINLRISSTGALVISNRSIDCEEYYAACLSTDIYSTTTWYVSASVRWKIA